ncbi:MAG: hypothetical protein KKE05_03140 [Nanoarchaeota archaeon]|nr:hypothetical protein [Nanoarchaeota archaeon]
MSEGDTTHLQNRIIEYLRAPLGRNKRSNHPKSQRAVMLNPIRTARQISTAPG